MQRSLFCLAIVAATSFGGTGYQKPPKKVLDVLTAKPTPLISVSPARDYAILMQPVRYPSIAEVSQPMLRLAGLRIDANTNGLHLALNFSGFELKRLTDGTTVQLKLPAQVKLSAPTWSPDGKHFAFTNTTEQTIDLWIATTATGEAKQAPGVRLNGVRATGSGLRATGAGAVEWLGDNKTVLARLIPAGRGTGRLRRPCPPVRTCRKAWAERDLSEPMRICCRIRTTRICSNTMPRLNWPGWTQLT